MSIDVNTGLPQLPEGYFWRVTYPLDEDYSFFTAPLDRTKLKVFLMEESPDKKVEDKRNKLIQRMIPLKDTWEKQSPTGTYSELCKGVSNQAIVDAAYRILKRQRRDKALSAKIGDYPPKKLAPPNQTR